MTELEKLKRAQDYMAKLAEGIDPISDKPLEEGSVFDSARLCRCFFYVSDVLKKVIANGGEIGKRVRLEFAYDENQIKGLAVTEQPQSITSFLSFIQTQMGEEQGKIPRNDILEWLIEQDYLKVELSKDGKKRKQATEKGYMQGITNVEVDGLYGRYTAVHYDAKAQRFILDNFKEIFDK